MVFVVGFMFGRVCSGVGDKIQGCMGFVVMLLFHSYQDWLCNGFDDWMHTWMEVVVITVVMIWVVVVLVLVSVIAVFLGDHPKPNASTGGGLWNTL